MHAHAHLTRPRLQTQCSTPARLEVNLAFGDFDFDAVRLHARPSEISVRMRVRRVCMRASIQACTYPSAPLSRFLIVCFYAEQPPGGAVFFVQRVSRCSHHCSHAFNKMFLVHDTFSLKSGYAILSYLHRTCTHACARTQTHTHTHTHPLALVHANRAGVIRARKLTRAHISP